MDNKKARVLAFSGDLGAGKTTFTQELARQFGIKETVVSPTFVIMKFSNIYYFKSIIMIFVRLYSLFNII